MTRPDQPSLAIVVVLYNTPKSQAIERAADARSHGCDIILINNSEGLQAQIDITPATEGMGALYYQALGRNAGIAAALNAGLQASQRLGDQYVITFDQDSAYDWNLVQSLLQTYIRARRETTTPMAIGPFPVNKLTNVSYLRRRDRLRLRWAASSRENGLFETTEIITSGLLADQATYAAIGSYDEALFIDFVDHEWCWRLRRKGGHVYVDLKSQLPHMVGNGEVPFTMGMKNSAPRRAYYIFRNGLGLIMSGRMPWYDAVKFLALIPVKLLVFSLMSQRTERWRFACQGIRDALR